MYSLDRIFVLCGGPSVAVCLPDPSILDPQNTIVVNNSYKLVPNALHLHFADTVWWEWNSASVRELYTGNMISSAADESRALWYREGIHFFEKVSDDGITLDKRCVCGKNSGHQAMNLAVHYGAKEIVLIGLDLRLDTTKQQWHTEHKVTTSGKLYESVFIPGFESAATALTHYGIKVWNANPASAVTCFEYRSLADFVPGAPVVSAEEILSFSTIPH